MRDYLLMGIGTLSIREDPVASIGTMLKYCAARYFWGKFKRLPENIATAPGSPKIIILLCSFILC